jgi:hypothetical protein
MNTGAEKLISNRIKAFFSRSTTPAQVVVPELMTPLQVWVLDLPLTWMLASLVVAVSFVYIGTFQQGWSTGTRILSNE